MTRTTRFLVAAVLVAILALTASGVWASQKFQGSVPPVPSSGKSSTAGGVVDMKTALFTPQDKDATISVDKIDVNSELVSVPLEGLAHLSDIFFITANPPTAVVRVCYSYPTALADKQAKIYRLNEESDPKAWVELPGAEVSNGTICVSTTAGYISLMGQP